MHHSLDSQLPRENVSTRLSQPKRLSGRFIHTIQPPVFRASTIIFEHCAALTERHWSDDYDYSYGTHGTPTTYGLAEQIAVLEGARYCVLAPSGLSAIHLVNSALLSTGDEVWLPDNAYGPNFDNLRHLEQRYGIILKIYDPMQPEQIQFGATAKLLWLEAAGSVTLEFPDLCALIRKAHAHGVLTALDNTWGAGLAFSAFDIGEQHLAVDLSVHALTKYPSGGGDILMGSICSHDKALHLHIVQQHALQGIAISGDDAAQISRSLPHIRLRYHQHHCNTLQIIEFLNTRPECAQVLHPSVPQHSGHAHWRSICREGLAAGLVSIILQPQYDLAAVQRFCDSLQHFHLGFSWGGPTSLVMYYDVTTMRPAVPAHLRAGWVVRLCIGLEEVSDLIDDLAQAFNQLHT